jgi:hypothetical protein
MGDREEVELRDAFLRLLSWLPSLDAWVRFFSQALGNYDPRG